MTSVSAPPTIRTPPARPNPETLYEAVSLSLAAALEFANGQNRHV